MYVQRLLVGGIPIQIVIVRSPSGVLIKGTGKKHDRRGFQKGLDIQAPPQLRLCARGGRKREMCCLWVCPRCKTKIIVASDWPQDLKGEIHY